MINDQTHLVQSLHNFRVFKDLISTTMQIGVKTAPRGLEIRELLNPSIELYPMFPFQSFEARRYNIDYFKAEMRWKLGASKYDESIKQYAKMWDSVQNPDGTFNSNYGQYWFGEQMGIWTVVTELIRDRNSRRACIPMLNQSHLAPHVSDTVCTESITFLIRDGNLHTVVHMRSSDQIFGLGTDVPTFSVLANLVLGLLQSVYPHLQMGMLHITAASSHIYERHFDMAEKIANEEWNPEKHIIVLPKVTDISEAMAIIGQRGIAKDEYACNRHWYLNRFLYGQA